MKEGAMMTVLSTLVAALALPATLVTASDLIDSQWAIAVDRLAFHLLEGKTHIWMGDIRKLVLFHYPNNKHAGNVKNLKVS